MSEVEQSEMVDQIVEKQKKVAGVDEGSPSDEEQEQPVERRSSRQPKQASDRMQHWNPVTKQYEGAGAAMMIEPTGSTKYIDGPWTAEESGEVAMELRRQPSGGRESGPDMLYSRDDTVEAAAKKSRSKKHRPSTRLRFFDTHSGTGGIVPVVAEIAHNTGTRMEVVAMCEISSSLRFNLLRRHPDTAVFADILDITEDELPDHDVYTCSPPCQDFSTAGNAHGFAC